MPRIGRPASTPAGSCSRERLGIGDTGDLTHGTGGRGNADAPLISTGAIAATIAVTTARRIRRLRTQAPLTLGGGSSLAGTQRRAGAGPATGTYNESEII